jgi:hypothetical protein
MVTLDKLIETLNKVSHESPCDPYKELIWPASLDPDQWTMTPELISLYGTSVYEGLSEVEKKRLSFYEAIGFFTLNIHGERHLMSGMAHLLYLPETKDFSTYLHHFLAEENKHTEYFSRFCNQYGKKIYPDLLQRGLPTEYAKGEEEFLYFAKVLIFEESFDRYNVLMAKDERLPQIVRDINRIHHLDESRHLAFGRRIVKELFDRHSPGWPPGTLKRVQRYLSDYIESFWRDLFNFRVYRDAGLPGDAIGIRDAALLGAQGREHFNLLTKVAVTFLLKNGILEEEPSPPMAAV